MPDVGWPLAFLASSLCCCATVLGGLFFLAALGRAQRRNGK